MFCFLFCQLKSDNDNSKKNQINYRRPKHSAFGCHVMTQSMSMSMSHENMLKWVLLVIIVIYHFDWMFWYREGSAEQIKQNKWIQYQTIYLFIWTNIWRSNGKNFRPINKNWSHYINIQYLLLFCHHSSLLPVSKANRLYLRPLILWFWFESSIKTSTNEIAYCIHRLW